VTTLRFQSAGFRQHFKSPLALEKTYTLGELHIFTSFNHR
jgi:hypothetical protein